MRSNQLVNTVRQFELKSCKFGRFRFFFTEDEVGHLQRESFENSLEAAASSFGANPDWTKRCIFGAVETLDLVPFDREGQKSFEGFLSCALFTQSQFIQHGEETISQSEADSMYCYLPISPFQS